MVVAQIEVTEERVRGPRDSGASLAGRAALVGRELLRATASGPVLGPRARASSCHAEIINRNLMIGGDE